KGQVADRARDRSALQARRARRQGRRQRGRSAILAPDRVELELPHEQRSARAFRDRTGRGDREGRDRLARREERDLRRRLRRLRRGAPPRRGTGAEVRRARGRRRPRWIPLGIALIALLAIAGVFKATSSRRNAPPVPDPDTSGREGLVVELLTSARKGVLEHPDSVGAWKHFAAVLDAHDHSAEAVTAYRRALDLAPDDEWC